MARAAPRNSDIDACGLTYSELQELWLGPCNGSVFDSSAQLRDAWVRGRGVVMRLWARGGRRPQAWWFLGDAASLGLTWPGYDRERSYLYAAGVLSAEERTEVEAEWRREFDAARGMGAREGREHLEYHDVPAELITAWEAERKAVPRRRRGRKEMPSEEAAATK